MSNSTGMVISSVVGLAPVRSIEQVVAQRNALVDFIKTVMVEGIERDYGIIPGTPKATLFKPGAEKLCQYFGLTPHYTLNSAIEDWTGDAHNGEPLFFYDTKCELYNSAGEKVGEADGSCNSWEKKYRYRWVTAEDLPRGANPDSYKQRGGKISEFEFAIKKAETSGKYGKPAEYWQKFSDAIAAGTALKVMRKTKTGQAEAWEIDGTLYAVPNEEVFEQVNTYRKISAKRAFVGAVINAVGASEFVTQDLEDLYVDVAYTVVESEPKGGETKTETPAAAETKPPAPPRGHPMLSPVQRSKMLELWRTLHGGGDVEATDGLDKLFTENFKHGLADATYEEGARLTGVLLAEIRAQQSKAAADEPKPVAAVKQNGHKPPAPKLADLSTEQRRSFIVKLKDMGLTYEKAKEMFGVESMKEVDLTADEALAALAEKLKAAAQA